MAELAGDCGLNEIRDAWGKIFIALAEIDELDGAPNVFQREPEISTIKPVVIDAFDVELMGELHDLARHKIETDDGAFDADKISRLEPLLEQLSFGLGSTFERLQWGPVPADQMLDPILVLERQLKRG